MADNCPLYIVAISLGCLVSEWSNELDLLAYEPKLLGGR